MLIKAHSITVEDGAQDSGKNGGNLPDCQLSLDVERLVQLIEAGIGNAIRAVATEGAWPKARSSAADLIELLRQLTQERRVRARFIPPQLLGEPGWDMLLELFLAVLEDRIVSTKSISIASGVPPTTALRWITVLELEGLVARHPCETDKRVTYVTITPEAFAMLSRYFADRWPHIPQPQGRFGTMG